MTVNVKDHQIGDGGIGFFAVLVDKMCTAPAPSLLDPLDQVVTIHLGVDPTGGNFVGIGFVETALMQGQDQLAHHCAWRGIAGNVSGICLLKFSSDRYQSRSSELLLVC